MTVADPSTNVNDESIMSNNDIYKVGNPHKFTPQTNNFTHEAMLLSGGSLFKSGKPGRAFSNVRGATQLADILTNTSMLQTNMSQSTMIDSSQPLKQKRSLNFINKKREAERIDQENS